MAKRKPHVSVEVRRIESRVRSIEATERMILTVKDKQLRDAEKLRRLAMAFLRASRKSIVTQTADGFRRRNQTIFNLFTFAKTLKPFHNLRPLQKRVTKWLAQTGRARQK